jgi:hypothetical protein
MAGAAHRRHAVGTITGVQRQGGGRKLGVMLVGLDDGKLHRLMPNTLRVIDPEDIDERPRDARRRGDTVVTAEHTVNRESKAGSRRPRALDVGCSIDGYYADAQFMVRRAPSAADAVAAQHDVVRRCILEVGLAAARPRTRASQVHRAMADFLAAEPRAGHSRGHGLGLEYRDYPIVTPDMGLHIRDDCVDRAADLPLEPVMVLNLKATRFLSEAAGAVGCELT